MSGGAEHRPPGGGAARGEAAPSDRTPGGAYEEHPLLRAPGARLVPPTRGGRVALAVVKAAFVGLGAFLLMAGGWAVLHTAAPEAWLLQPAIAFRALPAAAVLLAGVLAWRDARALERAWGAPRREA